MVGRTAERGAAADCRGARQGAPAHPGALPAGVRRRGGARRRGVLGVTGRRRLIGRRGSRGELTGLLLERAGYCCHCIGAWPHEHSAGCAAATKALSSAAPLGRLQHFVDVHTPRSQKHILQRSRRAAGARACMRRGTRQRQTRGGGRRARRPRGHSRSKHAQLQRRPAAGRQSSGALLVFQPRQTTVERAWSITSSLPCPCQAVQPASRQADRSLLLTAAL
jgi:hypothetical protein